jgi:hypothetical protein
MYNLNQKGSILIILIITITMISALSAGILSMTITSTISELNANNFNKAQYLAEAGIRYAKLNNLPDPTDKTYILSNGDKFHVVISGTTLESTGIVNEDTPLEARRKIILSDYTPPTNTPPVFTTDPITKPDATENTPYTGQTLAGSATDADGDTLTYSKVTGPTWLNIAPDGALSGTPGSGDVGWNQWTVEISDGRGGTDQATLRINVVAAKAFCGSTPMQRDGTGISAVSSFARALIPLFLALFAIAVWFWRKRKSQGVKGLNQK